MTLEDWQEDPWFEERVGVPSVLQWPLGLYGSKSHFDIAAALAEQLGSGLDSATYDTWHAIYCLIDPLAEAFREGSKFGELRPIDIARSAVRELDLGEAARATIELGWGKTKLRQPAIQDLEDAVRTELARRLHSLISKMLTRWEQRGIKRPGSKAS